METRITKVQTLVHTKSHNAKKKTRNLLFIYNIKYSQSKTEYLNAIQSQAKHISTHAHQNVYTSNVKTSSTGTHTQSSPTPPPSPKKKGVGEGGRGRLCPLRNTISLVIRGRWTGGHHLSIIYIVGSFHPGLIGLLSYLSRVATEDIYDGSVLRKPRRPGPYRWGSGR